MAARRAGERKIGNNSGTLFVESNTGADGEPFVESITGAHGEPWLLHYDLREPTAKAAGHVPSAQQQELLPALAARRQV